MWTTPLPRRLDAVVDTILERRRYRASTDSVLADLENEARFSEWIGWARGAIACAVRNIVRDVGERLVEDDHIALSLFSLEQYEAAMRAWAQLGWESCDKVYLLAAKCEQAHGTAPNADAIIAEALTERVTE